MVISERSLVLSLKHSTNQDTYIQLCATGCLMTLHVTAARKSIALLGSSPITALVMGKFHYLQVSKGEQKLDATKQQNGEIHSDGLRKKGTHTERNKNRTYTEQNVEI
jgi:hypothetical protein